MFREAWHGVDLVENRPSGGEEEVDPGDSRAAESVEHGDGGVCQRDAVIVGERGGHPHVGLAAVLVLVAEDPVAHDLQGWRDRAGTAGTG
jgi:hypothetical protein